MAGGHSKPNDNGDEPMTTALSTPFLFRQRLCTTTWTFLISGIRPTTSSYEQRPRSIISTVERFVSLSNQRSSRYDKRGLRHSGAIGRLEHITGCDMTHIQPATSSTSRQQLRLHGIVRVRDSGSGYLSPFYLLTSLPYSIFLSITILSPLPTDVREKPSD